MTSVDRPLLYVTIYMEYVFAINLVGEMGMKLCSLVCFFYRSCLVRTCPPLPNPEWCSKKKLMPLMLSSANWNSCLGVMICSEYGRCKLAFAASLLTVPPIPSQGPLPCKVAKKKNAIQRQFHQSPFCDGRD